MHNSVPALFKKKLPPSLQNAGWGGSQGLLEKHSPLLLCVGPFYSYPQLVIICMKWNLLDTKLTALRTVPSKFLGRLSKYCSLSLFYNKYAHNGIEVLGEEGREGLGDSSVLKVPDPNQVQVMTQ